MLDREKEHKKNMAAIRRVGKQVTASKEAAQEFLHKAGILTKTGKLAKPYR